MNCGVKGCTGKPRALGLCQTHYNRQRAGEPLGGPIAVYGSRHASLYDRVMLKVRWEGECLVFTGAKTKAGYGKIALPRPAKGHRLAHRVVLEHHHGPSSLMSLHSCDNPPCVNIAHLRYGTAQDNVDDMMARGRGRNGSGARVRVGDGLVGKPKR